MEKTFKQVYIEFLKDWKLLYIGSFILSILGQGLDSRSISFMSSLFFMFGPWILYRRMGWQTLFRYLEQEKLDERYRFKLVFAHYSFFNLITLVETIVQIVQILSNLSLSVNEKLFVYNSSLLMPELPGVYILVFSFFFFSGITYLVYGKYHQYLYFKKHESVFCPNKSLNKISFFIYIPATFLLISFVVYFYLIGLNQKTSLGIPLFNKMLIFASIVSLAAMVWEWFDLDGYASEETTKFSVFKYSRKYFVSLIIISGVALVPTLFTGESLDLGESHAAAPSAEDKSQVLFYNGQLVYSESLEGFLGEVDIKGKESITSKKIKEFLGQLKQNGIEDFYTANGVSLSYKYIEILDRGRLANFEKEAKKYLLKNNYRLKVKMSMPPVDLKRYVEKRYLGESSNAVRSKLIDRLAEIYTVENKGELYKIALAEKNKAITLHKALSKETDIYSEIARDAIMLNKREYFNTDDQTKITLIEELYNADINTAQMIAEEVPEMRNYIEVRQEESFRSENPINKEHTQKRGPASFDIDEMK